MSSSNMKVSTPELLWHGGGAENGKPDPVFSVDMLGADILATAGVDGSMPPKGSARLWRIGESDAELKFLVDLNDHQSTVNVVRFSPCGKMFATASDRLIIIYSLLEADDSSAGTVTSWGAVTDPKHVARQWLRPSLQEIYDLQWSPDSLYVVAGSIDAKGEILKVFSRDTICLRGHSSYVQGVAWDPLNKMVVTQSADRSCRIHQLKHKYKAPQMAKVITKNNQQIRMTNPYGVAAAAVADSTLPSFSTALEDPTVNKPPAAEVNHLYADSTVPCFFRRPCFTPDGSLLITPAGIHRPASSAQSSHDSSRAEGAATSPSFCTHVFLRDHLQSPILSLVGLEDPSVAVRCCPLLYQQVPHPPSDCSDGASEKTHRSLFAGDYRIIFAVVTTSSVMLFDTQHSHAIARIGGCHLATINDAAWSKDGRTLVFCSSDGYLTFTRFPDGVLGAPLPRERVPLEVQQAFPHVYDYEYTPPVTKLQLQQQQQEQQQEQTKGDEDNISTVASESKRPCPPSPAAMPTETQPVGAAPTAKKKRRITPMTISPLTTAASGAVRSSFCDLNASSGSSKQETNLLTFSSPCPSARCESVSSATSNHSSAEKDYLVSSLKQIPVDVNAHNPSPSGCGEVISLEVRSPSAPLPQAGLAPLLSSPSAGVAGGAVKKVKKRIAPTLLSAL